MTHNQKRHKKAILTLTNREFDLLELADDFGFLTTEALASTFTGNHSATYKRAHLYLTALSEGGFIRRTEPPYSRAPAPWVLTKKGADIIGGATGHAVGLQNWGHNLRLLGIALAIKTENPDAQVKGWRRLAREEIKDHPTGKRRHLVDAIVDGIGIELELSIKKKDRYKDIFISHSFNDTYPLGVLYLTDSEAIAKRLQGIWSKKPLLILPTTNLPPLEQIKMELEAKK